MTIPALFAKQDKTRRCSSRRRALMGAGEFGRHFHRRPLLLEPLEERALLSVVLSGVPAWLAQGPSPTINGQTENIANTGPGANPVGGAIHQVVAHPTDADLLYIGAVNGGVWRTTDATAANPAWKPLTDHFAGLSIGALQFDPTDATNNTLYAGIGRFSAFGREGGPLTGLLRTTDGGDTWEQVGATDLAGRSISGVGARGSTILASANAFGEGVGAGMYRSTDGGATFDFISGINGIDAGPVFYLADDPLDGDRFYASVGGVGLFRTDDAGANWVDVSQNDATLQSRIQAPGNNNTEMSVSPIGGRAYVGVLQNGRPTYIGFSDDLGANWTEMDLPISLESAVGLSNATNATPIVITSNGHGLINGNQVRITGVTGNTAANGDFFITRIDGNNFSLNGSSGNGAYIGGGTWQALSSLAPREKPGGQGAIHFSILADPTNVNIVYVGGDRQDTPFPNAIGATDFTGRLFRGDTSVAAAAPGSTSNEFSPQWQHLTHTQNLGFAGGGTANNSAPHADSRDMVFNSLGDLIQVDDGGIYRRTSPQDNTGDWFSLLSDAAGGLQVTEMHDVVYDPVSGIIISGNQDTGTTEQIVPGGLVWRSVTTADGGDVVVDILGAAPDSIRYSSTQNLGGFRYRVMDAANNQVGATVSPALNTGADPAITPQFVTPLATNNIVGDRLIIGGANGAYESTDRGENLTQVSTTIVNRNAIDYGGRRDGVDNPDVLYVGSGNQVLARTATTFGALAATSALPAGVGTIVDVLMHTEDWMTAFALDNDQVFYTTDAGAAWDDITGNLVDFNLRSLEFVFDAIAGVGALLAGGDGGVYRSLTSSLGTWTELGAGLPNAPVWDMDYDPIDDVLVAGTLGRGAWLIEDASAVVMNPGVLTICGDEDHVNQDDVFRLVRNDANPLILDVYVNSAVPVFSAPLATIQQINVFGVGGNDTLIVDSTNGLVNVPGGIRYNGDGACAEEGFGFGYDRGFDTLVLHQDGGPTHVSSSYLVGPGIGSGVSVIQGSGGPGDVQTIFFEELEPFIDLVPALTHTLTATPENNAINYSAGPNSGLVNPLNPTGFLTGLVTVDNYEGYEFANKTELIISAGAGDDVVNLNNLDVPAGLDLITVNGGDGNDHVTTSEGVAANVQFFGGAGNDLLDASGVLPGFTALLDGGVGNDLLIGGPGSDILLGGPGDDTLVSSSGDDTYDGGTGFNTLLVLGTPGNDRIDAHQSAANTLVLDVNGDVRNKTVNNIQEVRIETQAGNDIMRVRIADALVATPADSLRFHVVGGPPSTNDRLAVVDDGLGDVVIHRQGADGRSGSITVGPLAPVVYEEIEFVQVAPLDSITGGTGTDGEGRLVVFKQDPFEANNSRPNATFLGSGATINVDPVIDPGGDVLFDLPGDEDWFRVVAEKTGTLDFQVYFTVIDTLDNGRAGLPGDGVLRIEVVDVGGSAVPVAFRATGDDGARFRIPAVAGQSYYLRVLGDDPQAINVYSMTIHNMASPVPYDIELQDTPVGDPPPGNSDTGRSQFDNVTRDNTPTIFLRLDDGVFRFDVQGNDPGAGGFDNDPPIGTITIPFQTDVIPGFRVAIFDEGPTPSQPATNPQIPVGFADQVAGSPGLYTFTFPEPLSDGSHFLSARVQMIDPATPWQTGFGARSASLEIIVDTVPPNVSFGQPGIDGDGLISDSGVSPPNQHTIADRITTDTRPIFWGQAEANAIIRLFADVDGDGLFDPTVDQFIGQATAIPLDGTNQQPDGYWEIRSVIDLNDPAVFPVDGLRTIFVTATDVAGNLNAPGDAFGADADEILEVFIDTLGPVIEEVFITGSPGFPLFDPKPDDGPTPLVFSLSIEFSDGPDRVAPDFLFDALKQDIAEHPGHYLVVGDHNGVIPIQDVIVINHPPQDDQPATATVILEFFEPLPDDRLTLTVYDSLRDLAGNRLDGESNAIEPVGQGNITLPTGDGIAGGHFVARFTVDSRAEIGVWAAGSVYVDTNGNFVHDPHGKDADFTNRDITYMFGLASDSILAGNFVLPAAPFDPPHLADGFHKLAAYGRFGGTNRWLIDTDNSGVPNLNLPDGLSIDGLPLAGRFWDGVVRNNIDIDPNSDQVGVKKGTTWYLDTNANLIIDAGDVVLKGNMPGMPIVGDFDGDGIDDLGSWVDDVFYIDLSSVLTDGPVNPNSYHPNINGYWDVRFDFGFTGVRERPFAADFDGDGIDDIGLWVPDRSGATPLELAEWYMVTSGFGETLFDRTGLSFADLQALLQPTTLTMPFTPRPFGNDIYAQFGDNFALPVVGNFDPPLVPLTGDATGPLTDTNHVNPLDVNADGTVSALDVLMVINLINNHDQYIAQGAFNFANGIYPDVNGDSWITALDVLIVINHLNGPLATSPAGEGESLDVQAMVTIADQHVSAAALSLTPALEAPVPVDSTARPVNAVVRVADWPSQPATAFAADAMFAEMAEAERFGTSESEDETDNDDLFDDLAHDVDRWWKLTV